jgi:thioredoxin reductase
MHIDLIIVTDLEIDSSLLNGINYLITDAIQINRNQITNKENQNITFDYLIIDYIYPDLPLLKENKKIVTNQNFETSIERIFAIGEINSSKKNINDQLKIIIDYIKNPF